MTLNAFPDWPLTDLAAAHRLREAVLAQAAEHGVALRPFPPEPTTCCGRGCNGCVWEGYYGAVAFWREDALAALTPPGPRTA